MIAIGPLARRTTVLATDLRSRLRVCLLPTTISVSLLPALRIVAAVSPASRCVVILVLWSRHTGALGSLFEDPRSPLWCVGVAPVEGEFSERIQAPARPGDGMHDAQV